MVRPYIVDMSYIKRFKHNRIQKGIFELDNRLFASYNLKPLHINKLLELLVSLEDKRYSIDSGFLNQFTYTEIKHPLKARTYTLLKELLKRKNTYDFLKLFYNAGILQELFTNFRKVMHLPQFDGYHMYPVDIHSLKSIKALEHIEEENLQELYNELNSEEKLLLKIVTLFHDTGKGRKQDHSEVGAKIIQPFVKRFNFSDELCQRAVNLVKNHVLMSSTAFKENIHNEKTLYKFMSKVKDTKNLKMLYLLTYADINGVGGNTYNSFNAKLLNELYKSALEVAQNSGRITDATKRLTIEKRVQNNEDFKLLPNTLRKKLLRVESNLFFFKHTVQDIINIAIKAKETKKYQFSIYNEKSLTIEIYRKIPLNVGYLLGTLSHLDVGSMEIFTLFDDVKYFKIEFKKTVDGNELEEVYNIVECAFDMTQEVFMRKVDIRREEIEVDCEHSLSYAEISVNTKNQIGLLAYMMECFEKLGINIVTAKIHSTKHKVKDSFLMEKQNNICDNTSEIYDLLTKKG